MERKLFVLNATTVNVEVLTEKEFLEEYAHRVQSPHGIVREFQYDEETKELWQWQYGNRYVVRSNVEPEDGWKQLIDWAIMDAETGSDEVILVFDNKDEAIDYMNNAYEDFMADGDDLIAEDCRKIMEILCNL